MTWFVGKPRLINWRALEDGREEVRNEPHDRKGSDGKDDPAEPL